MLMLWIALLVRARTEYVSVDVTRAAADLGTAPLDPVVTPVGNLQVGGKDGRTDQTGIGTTPEITFDMHADYTVKFGERRVTLAADAFNLFNRQEPTNYDSYTELSFQVPNTNFGQPLSVGGGRFTSFQTPRQIRVGARFEW